MGYVSSYIDAFYLFPAVHCSSATTKESSFDWSFASFYFFYFASSVPLMSLSFYLSVNTAECTDLLMVNRQIYFFF